jgi:hypothetical protein
MAVTAPASNSNIAVGLGLGTTLTCALSGIGAASLVVAMAACDDTGTITRVRDDLTVDAVLQKALDWASGAQRIEHHYYKNYGGGSRVFTLTTSNTDFRGLIPAWLAGAHLTAPEGPTNSATGTSAAPAAGSVTPGADGAYIFATAFSSGGLTPTANVAWQDIQRDTGLQEDTQGLEQAVNAAVNATFGLSGSTTWGAVVTSWLPAPIVVTEVRSRSFAIQQRAG